MKFSDFGATSPTDVAAVLISVPCAYFSWRMWGDASIADAQVAAPLIGAVVLGAKKVVEATPAGGRIEKWRALRAIARQRATLNRLEESGVRVDVGRFSDALDELVKRPDNRGALIDASDSARLLRRKRIIDAMDEDEIHSTLARFGDGGSTYFLEARERYAADMMSKVLAGMRKYPPEHIQLRMRRLAGSAALPAHPSRGCRRGLNPPVSSRLLAM